MILTAPLKPRLRRWTFIGFLLSQGKDQTADIVTYIWNTVMLGKDFIQRDQQTRTCMRTHTSWEEGTDHEAEVDGGHGEDKQEDKDQGGVTVSQHSSIGAHLKDTNTV